MNFSDINISTLILSKYTDKKNYHRDYSKLPRPFHSIAIMLNGTGTLVYENLVIRLVPGDVFYIPQGSTYSSFWETDETSPHISYFSMHFSFEKPPPRKLLQHHLSHAEILCGRPPFSDRKIRTVTGKSFAPRRKQLFLSRPLF